MFPGNDYKLFTHFQLIRQLWF